MWEQATGRPVHRAIVWQCQRTAAICEKLRTEGHEPRIREGTGLVVAAYFSAAKMAWILDRVKGARERAGRGELRCGTIDTFLVSRLTSGEAFLTDITNASRTSLMNLRNASWDPELLELFQVPAASLPRIVGCAEVVGQTRGLPFLPDGIQLRGWPETNKRPFSARPVSARGRKVYLRNGGVCAAERGGRADHQPTRAHQHRGMANR